jgi:peptidoglycan/xylan/chitin deacetylase (PgdA/CDA1 family)
MANEITSGKETEAAAAGDGRTPRVAVLGYHKIGSPPKDGWETWFYVPETIFVAQLAWLRDHDWQVIDLPTFLRGLREPDSLPERATLLTFDDGYQSMRTVTLPCLQRLTLPAVLFVPTDYVGKKNSFDADTEPEEMVCDWHELAELERAGISVQSHGVSHRAFSGIGPEEQRNEIERSKAILESRLGKTINCFAYPYGDTGTSPEAATGYLKLAGYEAAFLYGGGVCCWPMKDRFSLPRLEMGPDTDLQSLLETLKPN